MVSLTASLLGRLRARLATATELLELQSSGDFDSTSADARYAEIKDEVEFLEGLIVDANQSARVQIEYRRWRRLEDEIERRARGGAGK